MNNEGKELLEALAVMYNRFCEKNPGDIQLVTEAYDKIRQLIQQKPEIDEEYVEEKAREIYHLPWEVREDNQSRFHEVKRIITQVIGDVQGKQVEVDEAFIEKWRGHLDKDIGRHAFTIPLGTLEAMLIEAGVKLKK